MNEENTNIAVDPSLDGKKFECPVDPAEATLCDSCQ